MKTCSKCKIEKSLELFPKDKSKKDGFFIQCKSCYKEYYEKNKEKVKESVRRYKQENKEKVKEYNKKYDKIYISNKLKTNSFYKFKHNTRNLILMSFKRGVNQYKKNAKTESILGCTIEEFKIHIEKQFKDNMSWENQGKWHLDHIKPLALAKTEKQVIELNHYTNFQPLWAIDNLSKGSKY
jgi:hypothetical protein